MGGSAHVAHTPASFTIADIVPHKRFRSLCLSLVRALVRNKLHVRTAAGLNRERWTLSQACPTTLRTPSNQPSSTDRKRRQSSFAGLTNRHRTPSNQPTSVARESRSHCPSRSAFEKITRDPCRSPRRQRQGTLGRPLNWHSADNWQRPARASPLSTHHCNNHESLLTSCSGRGDYVHADFAASGSNYPPCSLG